MKARDANAVEPLDSPDGREKRGRGSRIPSSDGAIVSGRVDSPGRLRELGRAPLS